MSKTDKRAVFAGSFDPFTKGHLDIVERAGALFDELWILVAKNNSKKNLFTPEVRKGSIESSVKNLHKEIQKKIHVDFFEGLTVDYMKEKKASYLVRGIRSAADIPFEQTVAWNNRALYSNAETVFLLSHPEHLAICSSVVRELIANGTSVENFVPEGMFSLLKLELEKIE